MNIKLLKEFRKYYSINMIEQVGDDSKLLSEFENYIIAMAKDKNLITPFYVAIPECDWDGQPFQTFIEAKDYLLAKFMEEHCHKNKKRTICKKVWYNK